MMDHGGNFDRDAALAVLAWWDEAGVGAPVSETPRDWLAKPAPAITMPAPGPTAAAPAPALLPDTLDAFLRWRAEGDDLPDARWGTPRIAPAAGTTDTMILVDMPEGGDAASLMEGEVGRLFDRMLAAIGLSRATAHVASLAWARPPGGQIDPRDVEPLAALVRHHVLLAAPKRLLLMGQATSRALCAVELTGARGSQLSVHHPKGQCPAIATYHPRFLLKTPAAKPGAWKDLLLFKGLEGA